MKFFTALAIVLAASAVHAQEPDAAVERARIKAEREVAEGRYAEAQKVCRGKFAVNDCLDRARRDHNEAVSGLKLQERVLDDAERKRRAADRQREIDERSSPARQQEAQEKRAKALADQQEREARATEKAAKRAGEQAGREQKGPRVKEPHGAPGPQGTPRAPHADQGSAPTPEEAARNRAAYEARLQEAEKHKAEVAQRNAKRTKPASPDLPTPPR